MKKMPLALSGVAALLVLGGIGASCSADDSSEKPSPVKPSEVKVESPTWTEEDQKKLEDAEKDLERLKKELEKEEKKAVSPSPKKTKKAPKKPVVPSFGNGTHKAGTDFPVGTYRTQGPTPSDFFPNCYWARHSNASGDFDAIITNGNSEGPVTVTINPGEYFESSGCQTWKKQ